MPPKKSLKQEILEEFEKSFYPIETDDITNDTFKNGKFWGRKETLEQVYRFIDKSIDKILETAKSCRPEDNRTEFEHQEDCDYRRPGCDCGREQNLAYQYGFNQSNAEFDNNWKDKIGE